MTIKIQSPFYSAGKWFGYEGAGIGIDVRELEGEGNLQVEYDNRLFNIDKKWAREFASEHNAYWEKGHTPKLAVLPLEQLKI